MRCEECLTLVEEFHDGELEPRRGERVSAHLAACADCAAALDALSFEQEMFLRYDRGLEVSPALWEGVRAGVARLEEAERVARPVPTHAPLPLLARLRGAFAASFGARTAFASSLALVVLGVALGALWLSDSRRANPSEEVAVNTPTAGRTETPAPAPARENGVDDANHAGVAPGPVGSRKSDAPASVAAATPGRVGVKIVNASASNPTGPGALETPAEAFAPAPPAADHLDAAEALLAPPPAAPADDVVALAGERLPDPSQKEMARHLEQAQSLLRSFQNSPAPAEGAAARVAYERQLSRRLLADNAALQLEAETSGDKETRQVLETLAPFLLDIANLRDDASREDVRPIKERMRKREIVAALHVY